MQQLAFDLGLPAGPPATVVAGCNQDAYAMVSRWPQWPHPVAMVTGPPGSGKSHLARIFRERTGAVLVGGAQLTAEDALALARRPVVVDDAHLADERALFHLINAVHAAASGLLLVGLRRPGAGLADLASRLQAMPQVALRPPDDALMRGVLAAAFIARQLPADPAVITFLLGRMERTLHAARRVVAAIDHAGLAERKGPTRPLAARILRDGGSPRGDIVP